MRTSRCAAGALAADGDPSEATTTDHSHDPGTETDTGDDEATSHAGTTDVVADRFAVLEVVVSAAEEDAGGTAYEVDDQDDDAAWEVDVAVGDRGVVVTVTPEGRIVGTEDGDLDDDDRRGLDAAAITVLDAVEVALEEVDGTLDDIELDEEDGTFVRQVTIETADPTIPRSMSTSPPVRCSGSIATERKVTMRPPQVPAAAGGDPDRACRDNPV